MDTRSLSYWRYSPLAAGGFIIPVAVLLRLGAASIANNPMPKIWFAYLVIGPMMGLVLHLTSKRVLFCRILDCVAGLLWLTALLALASTLAQPLFIATGQEVVAAGVAGALALVGTMGFIWDQRSWLRQQLPCGNVGKLDSLTGQVDPHAPTPRQFSQVKPRSLLKNPALQMVAGIVCARVATAFLSDIGKIVFLLFLVAWIVVVFAFGFGRVASICFATWRWEREQGKPIRLMR